ATLASVRPATATAPSSVRSGQDWKRGSALNWAAVSKSVNARHGSQERRTAARIRRGQRGDCELSANVPTKGREGNKTVPNRQPATKPLTVGASLPILK